MEKTGIAAMFHHHLSLVCLRMIQPGQNRETLVCSLSEQDNMVGPSGPAKAARTTYHIPRPTYRMHF